MKNENKTLTEEEKKIIAYCRHLEKGYSENSFPEADSFYIEKIAADIDGTSEENKKYKEMIEKAKRKGRLLWEEMGLKGIFSEKNKFNGSAWRFVMKNLFGWKDKQSENVKEDSKIVRVKLGFEKGITAEKK